VYVIFVELACRTRKAKDRKIWCGVLDLLAWEMMAYNLFMRENEFELKNLDDAGRPPLVKAVISASSSSPKQLQDETLHVRLHFYFFIIPSKTSTTLSPTSTVPLFPPRSFVL